MFDDAVKNFWIVFGEVGEDFAVNQNVFLFHRAHEFGVGETFCIEDGVDFDYPFAAACTFFVAAVAESIGSCVKDGFLGGAFVRRAGEAIALRHFEKVSSVFEGVNCFFYACHKIELKI